MGSLVCAVPAEHVSETMRALPIEPIAGAPPFVRGLSVVRGSPVPVLDAARIVGAPSPGTAAGSGMFVTLRTGGRVAALAVEAVIGVATVPPGSLERLPPLLRDADADMVSAIGTHDAALMFILNSARLAPASVWEAFDRRERPS
ncbi:MAG TPA: chemotaxis protein CheW [Polyangiaceae bacterium]